VLEGGAGTAHSRRPSDGCTRGSENLKGCAGLGTRNRVQTEGGPLEDFAQAAGVDPRERGVQTEEAPAQAQGKSQAIGRLPRARRALSKRRGNPHSRRRRLCWGKAGDRSFSPSLGRLHSRLCKRFACMVAKVVVRGRGVSARVVRCFPLSTRSPGRRCDGTRPPAGPKQQASLM